MVDKRLEFGLLGPLQMSVDGALVPLGTPKQRAVLAMLLMNRNSPVGVDRLITALWEGWPPSGARASMHSYVSNLRKLLTGVGIDPRAVLAAAPPGLPAQHRRRHLRLGQVHRREDRGRARRRGRPIRTGEPAPVRRVGGVARAGARGPA